MQIMSEKTKWYLANNQSMSNKIVRFKRDRQWNFENCKTSNISITCILVSAKIDPAICLKI